MRTVTYGIRPDGGSWIVVEQLGRARRAAWAFPTLVEALAFVGRQQSLRTTVDFAAKSRPS